MPKKKRKRNAALEAKATAGYEGRFEVGRRFVEDPYERGATIQVAFNKRHDVLTHWHARRAIDDAQYAAGRRFQAIWRRAEVGSPGALAYDRPHVDGGLPGDVFTEAMIQANQDLGMLGAVIGRLDFNLVCDVVGRETPVESLCAVGVVKGREPSIYIARRVRDALTTLAHHWGATGRASGRITGYREPVDNDIESDGLS